jgi:AAA+ ATPase superfamily predicted ATPase
VVIVANRFVDHILHDQTNELIEFDAELDEENIYRWKNIPFIIRESGILGSRYWKTEKYEVKRKMMFDEFKRVLNLVNSKTSP